MRLFLYDTILRMKVLPRMFSLRMHQPWTNSGKRFRRSFLIWLLFMCVALLFLTHSLSTNLGSGSVNLGKDPVIEIDTDLVLQDLDPSPLRCDAYGASAETLQDLRCASLFALTEPSIIKRSSNCQNYFQNFKNILKPKLGFPNNEKIFENLYGSKSNAKSVPKKVRLAFSLLIHENVGIFETLLHLVFRPYNSYCIHVDSKATRIVQQAVKNIIKCFQEQFPESNIFLSDFNIPVYWGHVSMLDAELQCLQLLDKRDEKWQFYLNLAGSELPLVQMSEIEESLSKLSVNQSIIQSFPMPEYHKDRYTFSHALGDRELQKEESKWYLFKKSLSLYDEVPSNGHYRIVPIRTENPKRPPPFNLTIYKGQKNVILSRTFSKFVLHHPVAKGFRRWCEDMLIPDESFYSTLLHITSVNDLGRSKDAKIGHLLDDLEKRFRVEQDKEARTYDIVGDHCIRRTLWDYKGCKGQLKRDICNLSVEDLPVAVNPVCQKSEKWIQKCLFLNKMNVDVDPLSVTCLAQHVLASERPEQKPNC